MSTQYEETALAERSLAMVVICVTTERSSCAMSFTQPQGITPVIQHQFRSTDQRRSGHQHLTCPLRYSPMSTTHGLAMLSANLESIPGGDVDAEILIPR